MERIPRIAVIGGGRMGEAIVAGWLAAGRAEAGSVTVAEPVVPRCEVLRDTYGVDCVGDPASAVSGAGIVVLAVKPQVLDAVVDSLASALPRDAVVVSIAAGVTLARLAARLPEGQPLVRVMPNTPAMVGRGMSVVSGGPDATPEQVTFVCGLFAALGDAVVVDERHQDAAAAISGSGPAYVATFIDALARAGVRQGLPRDVAQSLAVATVAGTAELLTRTGMHPEELVDAVCSPGGTTIAALEAFESGGFRAAVAAGVAAAVSRAKELGS